jgi:hypothetical protein
MSAVGGRRPVLDGLRLLQVRRAAGPWLRQLEDPRPAGDWRAAETLTAVYLGIDRDGRVGYCGQCVRELGVGRRVREHLDQRSKRPLFDTFHVVALHDRTPREVVDAIEGKLADDLGLRGVLRGRCWPSSVGWPALVASREAQARAAELVGAHAASASV